MYIVLLTFTSACYSQEVGEEVLEETLQVEDETTLENFSEYAEAQEQLAYLQRHPLDLNQATFTELSQLYFLNALQIQALLNYREDSGPFLSVLELQAIPGFHLQNIRLMIPYIRVSGPGLLESFNLLPQKQESKGWMMSTYSRTLEPQRGYQQKNPNRSRYLGSADKLAIRYRWQHQQRLFLTFNLEKDAGEPWRRKGRIAGFDHYSGSLMVKGNGSLKNILLGDYLMQIGQGLVMWQGAQYGGGSTISNMALQAAGIRRHTGMAEGKFMRGLAGSFQFGSFQITPFIGLNRLTANKVQEGGSIYLRSINYSGLHRTVSELKNRKSTLQQVYGMHVQWQKNAFALGGTYVYQMLEFPLRPRETLANHYRFRGRTLAQIGFHYQWAWHQLLLFGETAHSHRSGFANVHGILWSMGRSVSLGFHYRRYTKDYHHFYAQSVQRQSNLGNEEAYRLQISFHPSRQWEWNNGFEHYRFPEPRYRANLGSVGWQFQSMLGRYWSRKGYLRMRYQYKYDQENFDGEKKRPGLAQVKRQQLRLAFRYQLNENWTINHQLEGRQYEKEGSVIQHGILLLQDLIYHPGHRSWQGNFRIAYFKTGGYASRLYAYERNVLYSYSFPAYFNHGIRLYLNQRWSPVRGLDFWARIAGTYHHGAKKMGSGLGQSEGPFRSDLHIQMRYSW